MPTYFAEVTSKYDCHTVLAVIEAHDQIAAARQLSTHGWQVRKTRQIRYSLSRASGAEWFIQWIQQQLDADDLIREITFLVVEAYSRMDSLRACFIVGEVDTTTAIARVTSHGWWEVLDSRCVSLGCARQLSNLTVTELAGRRPRAIEFDELLSRLPQQIEVPESHPDRRCPHVIETNTGGRALRRVKRLGGPTTVFVGNLDFDSSERDVQELFSRCGEVQQVVVVRNRDTGLSRGFGFVTMSDVGEANYVINALNGRYFQGRRIAVREARSRSGLE